MKRKIIYQLVLLICIINIGCNQKEKKNDKTNSITSNEDYQPADEIFYYVFQRSFYDSNKDGHGDLNGLVDKLDYLEELGITSILMTPLYKSIYYHNYFPDDFMSIDPEYGSIDDYNNMIQAIHDRKMKFYMDMEIHYVTKNHPWFGESFENPESKYSNHIIYNGPGNTKPETIIFNLTHLKSYDGEIVDITTIDLYNESVKAYIYELFAHWVDPNKDGNFNDGVDGFRIDHMMDDLDWKGIRTNLLADFWGPLIKELKLINPELIIIGEQANWNDLGTDYFEKSDVDMMFAFSIRKAMTEFNKAQISNKMDSTFLATPENKHQLVFLENHDISRFASVVKNNSAKLRFGGAFTMFCKGIPLIYYGQEIGMYGDGGFGKFGETDGNDIPMREAFEWYSTVDGPGMAIWYKNSGPWWEQTSLKDNDGISVEEQLNDSASLLNFYKRIIEIRKSNKAFTKGQQVFIDNSSDSVITFCRWHNNEVFLLAFNTSENTANAKVKIDNLPSEPSASEVSSFFSDGRSNMKFDTDELSMSMTPFGFIVCKLK